MNTARALGTLLLGLWAAAPVEASTLQRFALIAGANYGGPGRARLKYAVSDAQRFNRVLHDLGGLGAEQVVVLEQPSVQQLQDGLETLRRRLAAVVPGPDGARPRTEVLLYYSGHADALGLLLGEDRYSYRTLREALDGMGADVRIAVLDACASGAITRLKGGQARPPFLVDASSRMSGHAFLTSSAADEAAQESDRIGASYFTYFLISGLRGAADVSGEGTVTLNEAYQFAFRETLGRTAGTRAGAQHPSYDINMSGAGDVVMTDLRATSAGLVLGEELAGRCFVRDAERRLVLELQKPRARRVELGLAPGRYELRCQDDERAFAASPLLRDGTRTVLGAGDFTPAAVEPARARGDAGTAEAASRLELAFTRDTVSDDVVSLGYVRWLRPRLALGVSLGQRPGNRSISYNPVSVTEYSGDITGLMFHLRRYLSGRRAGSGAYVFLAAGPQSYLQKTTVLRDEVVTLPGGETFVGKVSSTSSDHFIGLGVEGGVGVEAALGRRLSLGLTLGAQASSGLGNYGTWNGFSAGARLGYLFGPRR